MLPDFCYYMLCYQNPLILLESHSITRILLHYVTLPEFCYVIIMDFHNIKLHYLNSVVLCYITRFQLITRVPFLYWNSVVMLTKFCYITTIPVHCICHQSPLTLCYYTRIVMLSELHYITRIHYTTRIPLYCVTLQEFITLLE